MAAADDDSAEAATAAVVGVTDEAATEEAGVEATAAVEAADATNTSN